MPELIRSNKWKFKICIKDYLSSDFSPKSISKICIRINKQLDKLRPLIENSNIVDDEKLELLDELENISDNFEFMQQLCMGKISPAKWEDYSFSGDFEARFNSYLFELYELGDKRVETKPGISEKFIWLG